MRLFMALWPNEAAANELSAWAHDAQALCGGRVMRPEDMHLTLAFLGTTAPEQAQALIREVEHWSVEVQPFDLVRFGVFRRARVVWAGPAANASIEWLQTLYDTLWHRLTNMGWHRPDSVFTPHVSLLRGAGLCDVDVLHREPVRVFAQRCVLVASRPGESGSDYQVLAQLPMISPVLSSVKGCK